MKTEYTTFSCVLVFKMAYTSCISDAASEVSIGHLDFSTSWVCGGLLCTLGRASEFLKWHKSHPSEQVWKAYLEASHVLLSYQSQMTLFHSFEQAFKTYLEAFLVPLFRSLVCENQLCRAAAGRCLAAIRDCLGPGIFAGRLDDRQKTLMDKSPEVPPLAGIRSGVCFTTLPAHSCIALFASPACTNCIYARFSGLSDNKAWVGSAVCAIPLHQNGLSYVRSVETDRLLMTLSLLTGRYAPAASRLGGQRQLVN